MENGGKTVQENAGQNAAGQGMKNLQTLRMTWGCLLALVLLGACELFLLDATANYIKIYSIGVSGFFLVASFFIAVFSAGVLFWAVMKLEHDRNADLAEGMRAGAVVGAYAALAICALVAAFALFGAGPDKLLPATAREQGLAARTGFYLLVFLIIMMDYSLAGAIMGALAVVFGPRVRKRGRKKQA